MQSKQVQTTSTNYIPNIIDELNLLTSLMSRIALNQPLRFPTIIPTQPMFIPSDEHDAALPTIYILYYVNIYKP